MEKQKKTAFDCVLSDLSSGDNDWCSSICPVRNKCSSILCREECIEKLKSHYKQQATIPDGWDVVKEIYQEVNNRIKQLQITKTFNTYLIPKKMLKEIVELKSFIKHKFNEAGIEVG